MTRGNVRRVPGLRSHGLPLALAVVVSLLGGACADDEPASQDGARLTTRGAGALLANGVPAAPQPPGLEALDRPAPAAPSRDQELDIDLLGYDFGDADAPVRILEFSDFGCGFCRKFHMETLPKLREQYIDHGKVLWKAIPFVIGNWANSVAASMSAECALDQGKYEEMSELIFERQPDWKPASDPEEVLEGMAEEVGLDMERYRTCLTSDQFLWRVQAQTALARQVGVRSTPTFVVVGYAPFSGALPLEIFQQIIDTVLVDEAAAGGR